MNVTISSGASLSGAFDTGATTSTAKIVGFIMPAAWTAADLTFQGSDDNTTFNDVYDDNDAEVTVQAAQARAIGLRNDAQQLLSSFRYLKIRSGTTGTPVTQTPARTIVALLK